MVRSNSDSRSLDNRTVNKGVKTTHDKSVDISKLDAPIVIAVFAILALGFFIGKSLAL